MKQKKCLFCSKEVKTEEYKCKRCELFYCSKQCETSYTSYHNWEIHTTKSDEQIEIENFLDKLVEEFKTNKQLLLLLSKVYWKAWLQENERIFISLVFTENDLKFIAVEKLDNAPEHFLSNDKKMVWKKKISNKVIPVHMLVNEKTETFCFFDTIYDGDVLLNSSFKSYRDELAEHLIKFVKIYYKKQ